MTFDEYQLRMEAYQVKEAAMQEHLALQAWFSQSVQATTGSKKNPRPKFSKFNEFYDRPALVDKIRSEVEPGYIRRNLSVQEKQERQSEVFGKRLEEFRRLKQQGKIMPILQRKEEHNG